MVTRLYSANLPFLLLLLTTTGVPLFGLLSEGDIDESTGKLVQSSDSSFKLNYYNRKLLADNEHPIWKAAFSTLQDTENELQANVKTITEAFPGRHHGLQINLDALAWFRNALLSASGHRIELESDFGEYSSFIGNLTGSDPNNTQVLIFACTIDTWSNIPGANDNAVGMAILIELARYFAKNPIPARIYFLGFNGEHYKTRPPNRGQRELSPYFYSLNLNITLMVDIGPVLYRPSGLMSDTINILVNGFQSDSEIANQTLKSIEGGRLTSQMSQEYGQRLFREVNTSRPSYLFGEFPHLDIIQRYADEATAYPGDTYDAEGFSYAQAAEVAASIAAASIYMSYERSNGDLDGDGLMDFEEIALGTYPNLQDTDLDGLPDYEEVNSYGTDPVLADTDGDYLNDFEEIFIFFTDPLEIDTDYDGLNDYAEIMLIGTSPLRNDTDGDELSDHDEFEGIFVGLDFPGADSDGYITTQPTRADTDDDGLSDGYEINTSMTNPRDRDTDDDGFTDGEEEVAGYDPLDKANHPLKASSEKSDTKDSPGFGVWAILCFFIVVFLKYLPVRSRFKLSSLRDEP